MPSFEYIAIDGEGRRQKGTIEAHDLNEAKAKLRAKGLMVSHLALKAKKRSKNALRGENLMMFTLQLSQLVNAGVPIYESLLAIEEQYQRESFHEILLSLCEKIKQGSSLSEAMAEYPESFDKLYRSMIAAGESAGALDLVLERLSHLLSKQMKLKKEITTAMIYPSILAIFSLLVIGLLLGFVVPSIEGIFADRPMNTFTAFVIGVSRFAREKWWIYLPILAGLAAIFVHQIYSQEGRIRIQKAMMHLPLFKTLMIRSAVARFSRTMATLQRGGVTVIESLRMATEVMHNVIMEEEMKKVEGKIIEGRSLSQELNQSQYMPKMVSRMIAIGEDTGNTIVMLEKIADMYEDALEKTLTRLVALAQPAILIIMGGVIGAVMVAILLPLTDVASFNVGQ
ncbi:MAG: type II secretion system F family protein [Chlamydiales bacterium]